MTAELLRRGGTAALPTDTVYGLSAAADKPRAVRRIARIKERDGKKSFILLISSLAMARKYCFVNKKQAEILKKIWFDRKPGARPVSAILKSRGFLSKELEAAGSLALRLPRHDFFLSIIRKTGAPVISTSLNISGRKTMADVKKIAKYFRELPDLAVDAGPLAAAPSRIADLRDSKKIIFLR